MKKAIAAVCIVSALLVSTTVYARGGYGGYYYQRPYHYGGYHHPRPYYYNNYHHSSHYDSGDVIAGVAVGLLTGAIIASAFAPPPPPVYTTTRYTYVQAPVVVEQPRVCVEERVVSGEWQQDPNTGGRYWVTFPYPMKRSYQIPCY